MFIKNLLRLLSKALGDMLGIYCISNLLIQAAFSQSNSAISIVFDFSGSMGSQTANSNISRLASLQREFPKILTQVPKDTSLALYGVGGDCKPNLLAPLGTDPNKIDELVSHLTPTGGTPLALNLEQAIADLSHFSGQKTVVVLSDGLEGCGGDPCAVVAKAKQQGITVKVHVIALELSQQEQSEMECLTAQTGGSFVPVDDVSKLSTQVPKDVLSGQVIQATKSFVTHIIFFILGSLLAFLTGIASYHALVDWLKRSPRLSSITAGVLTPSLIAIHAIVCFDSGLSSWVLVFLVIIVAAILITLLSIKSTAKRLAQLVMVIGLLTASSVYAIEPSRHIYLIVDNTSSMGRHLEKAKLLGWQLLQKEIRSNDVVTIALAGRRGQPLEILADSVTSSQIASYQRKLQDIKPLSGKEDDASFSEINQQLKDIVIKSHLSERALLFISDGKNFNNKTDIKLEDIGPVMNVEGLKVITINTPQLVPNSSASSNLMATSGTLSDAVEGRVLVSTPQAVFDVIPSWGGFSLGTYVSLQYTTPAGTIPAELAYTFAGASGSVPITANATNQTVEIYIPLNEFSGQDIKDNLEVQVRGTPYAFPIKVMAPSFYKRYLYSFIFTFFLLVVVIIILAWIKRVRIMAVFGQVKNEEGRKPPSPKRPTSNIDTLEDSIMGGASPFLNIKSNGKSGPLNVSEPTNTANNSNKPPNSEVKLPSHLTTEVKTKTNSAKNGLDF